MGIPKPRRAVHSYWFKGRPRTLYHSRHGKAQGAATPGRDASKRVPEKLPPKCRERDRSSHGVPWWPTRSRCYQCPRPARATDTELPSLRQRRLERSSLRFASHLPYLDRPILRLKAAIYPLHLGVNGLDWRQEHDDSQDPSATCQPSLVLRCTAVFSRNLSIGCIARRYPCSICRHEKRVERKSVNIGLET